MPGPDQPSRHPPSVDPVDVLIITAADGEDAAAREVLEGALGDWEKTPGPSGYGFAVWRNRFHRHGFHGHDGGTLTVALTRAVEMGGEGASNAAARLVDVYKPRCLAMCGVCAGNPERVSLGDVIIADRVWRYDVGEQRNATPGAQPEFFADTMTYPFNAQWKQAAENFSPPGESPWLATRPRERSLQRHWLLRELLANRDPLASPDRAAHCADWKKLVQELLTQKLIVLKADKAALTARGRKEIEKLQFTHAGELPQPPDWKIAVGPMATGNNLVKDVDVWEQLRPIQRHVVGLEMEASVIGFTAHVQNVPYMLVVKGVMDYAVPYRPQGFRRFAARASAEVLLAFLRTHLLFDDYVYANHPPSLTVDAESFSNIEISSDRNIIKFRFSCESKDQFDLRIRMPEG